MLEILTKITKGQATMEDLDKLDQQMNARLWRQGQEETVVIHHLIAKGTLDERVMAALEKKDCGQSALVDAVKARIGGVE